MKKWLIGIGVVVIALGAAAWIYQDFIRFMVMARLARPSQPFNETSVPAAPNYSEPSAWAALPTRADGADFVPPGGTDAQANAPVDVFFVHPTTYLKPDGWNQPLDDEDANTFTDRNVLRGQASAFNGCCKVYAPRYRQATFASFIDKEGNGEQAIALAYRDVETAFNHFLANDNDGRPFILAGHSQGSRHIFELLKKRIAGTPLKEQLVAAYPIGYGVNRSEFAAAAPDLPICSSPTETGCVVTWNAVAPTAPIWGDPKDNICVNPLTWKVGPGAARHDLNLGSLSLGGGVRVVEKVADAECIGGRLIVTEIRSDQFKGRPMTLGRDNYHILDFALYYMNLRRNARERVEAYIAKLQS